MADSDEDETGIVGIWLERTEEEVPFQGGELSKCLDDKRLPVHFPICLQWERVNKNAVVCYEALPQYSYTVLESHQKVLINGV